MKFGKVDNPGDVDFTLPPTHTQTKKVLEQFESSRFNDVRIGCAKWNKKDLKNFYPRGSKELEYYSTQFNSIEFNASFYRMFPKEQFEKWASKAEDDFKFFPKIPNIISHFKRLNETETYIDDFALNIQPLEDKLGMCFLQTRDDFGPANMKRVEAFFHYWPQEVPLSAEFRQPDWYSDEAVAKDLNDLLMQYNITHTITDSPGRRDLVHMRLTTDTAFIRYNGANHKKDYERLDEWLDRLEEWYELGLKNVYFFVHQHMEEGESLLSAYFIEKFIERFNYNIKIPKTLN